MSVLGVSRGCGEQTVLRILHPPATSPLDVDDFQNVRAEPQVKISKHLAYLRNHRMVSTERAQNWIIYSLPPRRPAELDRNLKCLQDCVRTNSVFRRDLRKLKKLQQNCCQPARVFGRGAN